MVGTYRGGRQWKGDVWVLFGSGGGGVTGAMIKIVRVGCVTGHRRVAEIACVE